MAVTDGLTPSSVTAGLVLLAGFLFLLFLFLRYRERVRQVWRERQLRMLLDAAREGVWSFDAAGCTSYVNTHLVNMLGLTAEALRGRPLTEFVLPSSRKDASDLLYTESRPGEIAADSAGHDEAAHSGRHAGAPVILSLRKADNTMLDVSATCRPLFDSDGQFEGSVLFLSEQNGLENAQRMARLNQDRLRVIFDSVDIAICHVGSDGIVLEANPCFAMMFDEMPVTLTGRPVTELLHLGEEEKHYLRVPGRGEILRREILHDDRRLLLTIATLPSARSDAPDFLVSMQDLTEIWHITQRLAQMESRQALSFQGGDGGYLLVDEAGVVLDADLNLLHLLGRTLDETVHGMGFLELVFENDHEVARCMLTDLFQLEEGRRDWECLMRKANGLMVNVRINAVRLEQNGRIVAQLSCRDISAQRRQENLLAGWTRMLDALTQGVPLEEILGMLATIVESLRQNTWCAILQFHEDQGLSLCAGPSLPAFLTRRLQHVAVGEDEIACGAAMHFRARIVQDHLDEKPCWLDLRDDLQDSGVHSCWSEPIFNSAGEVKGALDIYFIGTMISVAEDRRFIKTLASFAGVLIERRQEEAMLEHVNHQLLDAQRIARMGSWRIELASGYLHWSDEIFHLLGHTSLRFMPTMEIFLEHVHNDDRPEFRRHINEARAGGKVGAFECRILRANGTLCYVRNFFQMEKEAQGAPIRLLGVMQDITEQKDAENALRASELRYRSLFETSRDGLAMLSLDGFFEDANRALLEILDYSLEELCGMSMRRITPKAWHDVERRIFDSQLIARGYTETYRKELKHRGGRTVPVSMRCWIVRDRFGRPQRIMASVRDITEQIRSERELDQLQRGLQQAQKMEAIGHLTGGIAHDFNNILASILGYTDLALSRYVPDKEGKLAHYLRQVEIAGERARDLISQMLIFSRGETSEGKPIMISAVVKSTIKMLKPTLPASLRLRTTTAPDLPTVVADPVKIQQVVMNLIINARDAMEGSGSVIVSTREQELDQQHYCSSCHAAVSGRYVILSVRDHGSGIAPEVREKIFDPFFTTKEVGQGSGMGLPVVHGIVHEYGGHILLDSVAGEGAEFRILLPPSSLLPENKEAEEVGVQAMVGNSEKILVVDDDENVARLLGEIFSNAGYSVLMRYDPESALEVVQSTPDLRGLITDQVMPVMLGMELIVRARELNPSLAVVLLSAQADILPQTDAYPVLPKPVDVLELFRALRQELGEPHDPVSSETEFIP